MAGGLSWFSRLLCLQEKYIRNAHQFANTEQNLILFQFTQALQYPTKPPLIRVYSPDHRSKRSAFVYNSAAISVRARTLGRPENFIATWAQPIKSNTQQLICILERVGSLPLPINEKREVVEQTPRRVDIKVSARIREGFSHVHCLKWLHLKRKRRGNDSDLSRRLKRFSTFCVLTLKRVSTVGVDSFAPVNNCVTMEYSE